MGKWETVGQAMHNIWAHADAIRSFVTEMEHYTVGIDNIGALRADFQLLMKWMHHPKVWFDTSPVSYTHLTLPTIYSV